MPGAWTLVSGAGPRRIDAAFKSGASAALHARTWHRLKSGFPSAPASVLPQHGGGGCATAVYGLYMGQPHSYPHSFARRAAGWLASGGLRSCTLALHWQMEIAMDQSPSLSRAAGMGNPEPAARAVPLILTVTWLARMKTDAPPRPPTSRL